MRIAYIATGAAGMVCGTCIHDNTLAAALIKQGHEVALIPTYTPIRTDEESVSMDRIFFGGLNVYLQEKIGFFRHTPAFIDNLLNGRRLLDWLSRFSGSTNAKELGAMTVSMLRGEEGNQRKELMKLIAWLKEEYQPDIVHLNHSLLLGFVHEIKRELNVPVVCGVQGEDLFLDTMVEPYRSECYRLMGKKASELDGVVATSKYYAELMTELLQLPKERVHVVELGIKLEGYDDEEFDLKGNAFVIGYLARICPEKGLHLLLEAFRTLRAKHPDRKIRLRIAGYLGKKDEKYWREQQAKISRWGLDDHIEYLGEVDRLGKIIFLKSLDLFSVPTVYRESKGLSILESMANGVPVVQPKHGSFPEMIANTRGGVLVEPESVDALVDGLEELMLSDEERRTMAENGKKAVREHYSDSRMAENMTAFYRKLLSRSGSAVSASFKDLPRVETAFTR